MELARIKDWLVPVSTFITLLTASAGIWLSLAEYRVKVRAETRLANSATLEADIKLLKLFTDIMTIANARSGYHVSEKAIERILSPELSPELSKELGLSGSNLREKLENSVITLPVGEAAQDAAIAAIWVLGKRHDTLMPVAIQALETLSRFEGEVTNGYLKDLRAKKNLKDLRLRN